MKHHFQIFHGTLNKTETLSVMNDELHSNRMKLEDKNIFDFSDSFVPIVFFLSFSIFLIFYNLYHLLRDAIECGGFEVKFRDAMGSFFKNLIFFSCLLWSLVWIKNYVNTREENNWTDHGMQNDEFIVCFTPILLLVSLFILQVVCCKTRHEWSKLLICLSTIVLGVAGNNMADSV